MNFSEYTLQKDGIVMCEPCVCVTLFSDADLGVSDAPEMLGPYRAFLELFQDQLDYCVLDGDQARAQKITADHLQNLPREMQDLKRRKQGGIIALLRHGSTPQEKRAPAFEFNYSKIGKPHTYVRACFPLPWFDWNGLEGIERYLKKSLKSFALQSGYVGFCFVWNPNFDRELDPYYAQWLQRHPGIMCPSGSQSIVSIHGLTDIGWITLLGKDMVEKMGGMMSLNAAVTPIPGVTMNELADGGASIRIDDRPHLGDTHNGDTLEAYRALGKVLNPLRNRHAVTTDMSVPGMRERDHPGLRAKWLDRFFPK
ncbi:type VI immunity family protein [Massilia aquatica]|uniref:DUF3396 domain-containing protein n=1 Tax=Massilia aquatica TaxID=2609000 RepID=A0ABX0LYC3_9BURK|nr:type VI immunity family protein [Massilia aquatica]NHZ38964.1 DUF3396 domain-containing protein [Massilia aquatica]